MKKLITILLAGMMTLSLAACGGTGAGKPADTQPGGTTEAKETAAAGSGKAQFYSFGAGGSGGTWYTMVGGIISLFNDNIPNSSFSVSATGGSVFLSGGALCVWLPIILISPSASFLSASSFSPVNRPASS